MRHWRLVVWVVLGPVGPAWGQVPGTQPATTTYYLRVLGDHVRLRTRADGNAMIVAQVDRDTILEARGVEFGWHRVVPPEGVYSLVSARYVERSGPDRGVVRVRSGNLRVRAGSRVFAYDPLDCPVQTLLPNGTPVRILGEQDGWLRIVPPEGVFVYIADRYVERVSAQEARRLAARGVAVATQPATRPAAPKPARSPAPVAARGSSTRPAIATTRPVPGPVPQPAGGPAEPRFRPFDATGELEVAFELPVGGSGLRYKVVAPLTRRPRAYLEIPADLEIDAPRLVGEYVGVRGQRLRRLGAGLWLIRVRELVVLGAATRPSPPSPETSR